MSKPQWYYDALSAIAKAIKACPEHRLYPLAADGRVTRMKCVECPYTEKVTS